MQRTKHVNAIRLLLNLILVTEDQEWKIPGESINVENETGECNKVALETFLFTAYL